MSIFSENTFSPKNYPQNAKKRVQKHGSKGGTLSILANFYRFWNSKKFLKSYEEKNSQCDFSQNFPGTFLETGLGDVDSVSVLCRGESDDFAPG